MIGIFDSGVGGLTVAREIMAALPEHDLIYFGDTARTPYGGKSPETIASYAFENTSFLIENGAKIIVIACNTAASFAAETVKNAFNIPLFEVITPAVELAVRASKKKSIGIIGTRATVNSGVYEKKIRDADPAARVWGKACPLLVPLVEEGWIKKPETRMIIKKYLHPLKVRQIDTLILGCTHYPVLQKTIQEKIGRRVKVINSAAAVAGRIAGYLEAHPDLARKMGRNGRRRFCVSDITPHFQEVAGRILHRRILLEKTCFGRDLHPSPPGQNP